MERKSLKRDKEDQSPVTGSQSQITSPVSLVPGNGLADPQSPVPGPEIAISVRNLSKKYKLYDSPQHRLKEALNPFRKKYHRDFWALKDVSFEVKKGETVGIIGKNGSGKSTLLQLICGILQPTDGEVTVNGMISALLELGAGFNPNFTGRENVYMNGAIRGYTKEEIDSKFQAIIEFADIGDFIEQPVKTYSSGMYVRLAFAIAINVEPDILIVDEALSVGDIFFKQKCYARLEEFRNRGVPIILVSHAMTDVEQFCQRALLLDKGNVLFEGSASEAVKRYYLLEQKDRTVASKQSNNVSQQDADLMRPDEKYFWPPDEAFFDISLVSQVSNGWAKCTGIALCNADGEPCRNFQQGERASFFYEFELLRDIEVPIGGVVISNEKNILVHGKSTIEYGTEVPTFLAGGSKVRFRQNVALELQNGEYTFEIGLAAVKKEDFDRRSSYLHQDLRSKYIRICHLPRAGFFAVTFRKKGMPVQLLHHGLCNLPGDATVYITKLGQGAPSLVTPSIVTQTEMPTIFHITHWKAGSQWIYKILNKCAPDSIIAPKAGEAQFVEEPIQQGKIYPTTYVTKEQFEKVVLPENWRRFVIIRDLRDTLVSSYFSIKISHPILESRMKEWRERLNSLTLEEGLIYLIDEWLFYPANIQGSWSDSGEKIIRYEDLLEHDVEILEPVLLDQCKLPVTRERFREIVLASRFENLTKGRKRGEENLHAHERKGVSGDWRNYFSVKVKDVFKARYGALLVATGYEKDLDW